MSSPCETPFERSLPAAAEPAVEIVRALVGAGHRALLAGGCVRDLLLGATPKDYDVATDAPPDRVCALFRSTRKVGAQFGVVLVRRRRLWVEVATFRSDGAYRDGRRPESVTFASPREDAERRDFTINGMFVDPLAGVLIDFVGGRADLAAKQIRAIGDPKRRFDEDHLRLIRAVRFAARLGFEIEPRTFAAIRADAACIGRVAAERLHDELRKMLAAPGRARALRLLAECDLLNRITPAGQWSDDEFAIAERRLGRLSSAAGFEPAFALLAAMHAPERIEALCRALAFSNDEREVVLWLVAQQATLDDPDAVDLPTFKRLLAHPAFPALREIAIVRQAELPDGAARAARLRQRIGEIPPERIAPPPLVTGEDLHRLQVPPGPVYKEALEWVYTRQLAEEIEDRAAAIAALQDWLAARKLLPAGPPRRGPNEGAGDANERSVC